jgi:hypothetical protein
MMKYFRYLMHLISAIFFFALPVRSQDITGTWVGSSGQEYVKLVVIHKGDSVYGYTYDEGPGFCKATFEGKFDPGASQLKGQGMEMLRNSGTHGLAVYKLNYLKEGNDEFLRGPVAMKDKMARILSFGINDFVQLKKFRQEVDTIAYMHKQLERLNAIPEMKDSAILPSLTDIAIITKPLPAPPSILKENIDLQMRGSKLVQTIFTDEDSLKMFVYDNGTVDDDTVTIIVDGNVLINRYRISGKAKEINLPLFKSGNQHSILLYANNLGSIPPNTALIIIMAGKKRYELRASYDLQTNAEILIRRKDSL